MEIKYYEKKKRQAMFEYVEGMSMEGISVSENDLKNGSPKVGDMIAISNDDPNDKWLIHKEFFINNYNHEGYLEKE